MEYTGTWAIRPKEIAKFLHKEKILPDRSGKYMYKSCTVSIKELPAKGILHIPQTQISISGNDKDGQELYTKLLYTFLSAGG